MPFMLQQRISLTVLGLVGLLWTSLSLRVAAEEPVFSPLPTDEVPVESGPDRPASDPLTDSPEGRDVVPGDDRTQVAITLPELITWVVAGNRDLRDRQLQRLIEQQQLDEAEARFDPRVTPAVGIGIRQRFDAGFQSGTRLPGSIGGSNTTELGDRTTLTQSAGVLGEVTTRQGTTLGLTLDALGDIPIGLQFTQPLLRGFGTAINEAPVEIARLQESQNVYDLQQTLIETVSTTVTQYTSLIQAQESVAIQTQALARRQQQLEILTALVAAAVGPNLNWRIPAVRWPMPNGICFLSKRA
jgi:outer membrane protein